MTKEYNHQESEKKWQKFWEEHAANKTGETGDKKFYILDMFPYPSGEGLHVGHPKGYIATDVYSRMKKMQGFDVLHPMGFDAFGLPAEQYAIKNKVNPAIATARNVARYKEQLQTLGLNYDWEREVSTTDPEFYKWTQWMFKQMWKKGLAYESYEPINWCPTCKTGLANEDLEGNACERCGTLVEKKPLRQWTIRITDYADRLLTDLDKLNWEPHIKELQRNWIGKSEGSEIDFVLKAKDFESSFTIFTTRADTLFGCTYTVLAPEHPLVGTLLEKGSIENSEEVKAYQAAAAAKTDIERGAEGKEKTGVKLEGVIAINPANGKEVPVYVADYVLSSYGTGAIMAVPAHDERDREFAEKFGIEILDVPFTPVDEVLKLTGGKKVTKYKLREWVFARQRYWGEPFPIVFDENHKAYAVADSELPVLLPPVESYEPTGTGESPLAAIESFVNVYGYINEEGDFVSVKNYFKFEDKFKESILSGNKLNTIRLDTKKTNVGDIISFNLKSDNSIFGYGIIKNIENKKLKDLDITNPRGTSYNSKEEQVNDYKKYYGDDINLETDFFIISFEILDKEIKLFKRETNTMPQWAGSSWYYLRFIDPKNNDSFVSKEKESKWSPVDFYVGGAEHATRHLIYARFWHKFLFDLGLVSSDEPFMKLQTVGLIMAEDGRKMSKRWGNVVNPDDIVREYGADTLRLYEMFMGPFESSVAWSTKSMVGSKRFLDRVFKLSESVAGDHKDTDETLSLLHGTIKKVGEDIEAFKFNTAISSLMILLNFLEKQNSVSLETYKKYILLLSPFAPHMCEELWKDFLQEGDSVTRAEWPTYEDSLLISKTATYAIQVSGKLRGSIQVSAELGEEDVTELAKKEQNVAKWLEGAEIKKVIFVKNKLVNFVV